MRWSHINGQYRTLHLGYWLTVDRSREGDWTWRVQNHQYGEMLKSGTTLHLKTAKSNAIDAARKLDGEA